MDGLKEVSLRDRERSYDIRNLFVLKRMAGYIKK
jgi:hypothetical protein